MRKFAAVVTLVTVLIANVATAADYSKTVLPTTTIGVAATRSSAPVMLPVVPSIKLVSVQAVFVYAAGGTTAKAYVQTSLDGGVTWFDIACFAFTTATATRVSAVNSAIALTASTTPTDGSLADNTIVNGVMGDRIRVKVISTGTYTGATTLKVSFVAR